MPIETIPEAEPRIAEDDGIDAVHPDWLPIVQTLLAGYRIIAENFISFTVVTLLLAVIHFSFVETSPLLLANSGPGVRTVVLHAAITLTSFVCTSLVLAIA